MLFVIIFVRYIHVLYERDQCCLSLFLCAISMYCKRGIGVVCHYFYVLYPCTQYMDII